MARTLPTNIASDDPDPINYEEDWNEGMYDPSTSDKWGSEAGGAFGGSIAGMATVAPFASAAGPYAPLVIGGAAILGGIAGWLANTDNEQQEAMAKLEYEREQQKARALARAEGKDFSAAVSQSAQRAAKEHQRLRAAVFTNPNLTNEQKWRQWSEISAEYKAAATANLANLKQKDMEIAQREYDLLSNRQFDRADKERLKASEVRWALAESGTKQLAYQQYLRSQEDPDKKDKQKSTGVSSGVGSSKDGLGMQLRESKLGDSAPKGKPFGLDFEATSDKTIGGVDDVMYKGKLDPHFISQPWPDGEQQMWQQSMEIADEQEKNPVSSSPVFNSAGDGKIPEYLRLIKKEKDALQGVWDLPKI